MNIQKKIVFLIDDDEDYRYQMILKLESFGFVVMTAEDQKSGEELISKLKPDLAIIDLMMENDDSGFILSYKLKQKYPEVPVIIATAVTSETGHSFSLSTEFEKKWIKADLYLDKGLRDDQLHREIKRLLKM